ncbi:hypothetical protein LG943_23660 [Streptomonospora sp. S1-112]|uniref:Uncharacterized protein n=1 Tax=Streptomonospora mangrovi TaxID=2883123 RepID=A0A9X3NP50_9ACTN|nr:hypothetical protein [Streptomonospora mangrovi]MDA0567292.1 hypothetical protein [Streptomonospora mangrovi]
MPETTRTRRAKQGVHGWRAFLLMFGCGTTAAVLVMAVIVGGLRLVASTVGSAAAPEGPQSIPTREPRESMSPGLLDLCAVLEQDVLTTDLYPRRQDDGGTPPDSATMEPAPDPDFRTVEDECSWLVSPDGLTDWRLELSYTAYVESSGSTSVAARAEEEMASAEQRLRTELAGAQASPGKSTWGDAATALYAPGSGVEPPAYAVVMRKKGAVCELVLRPEEQADGMTRADFEVEADPALTAIDQELHHLLPDR